MFEWQAPQRQWLHLKSFQRAYELERCGVGWTGIDPDGVVGCAGFMPTPWGIACWAAFSERIALHARPVMRFVRQKINNRGEAIIRTLVAHDHPKAARFAEALGFELEKSPADSEGHQAVCDLYRFKRG